VTYELTMRHGKASLFAFNLWHLYDHTKFTSLPKEMKWRRRCSTNQTTTTHHHHHHSYHHYTTEKSSRGKYKKTL